MKNKTLAGEFVSSGICRNRKKRKGAKLRNLALLVAAATMIGSAVLIYLGETDATLWASSETRDGKPTLEIRP